MLLFIIFSIFKNIIPILIILLLPYRICNLAVHNNIPIAVNFPFIKGVIPKVARLKLPILINLRTLIVCAVKNQLIIANKIVCPLLKLILLSLVLLLIYSYFLWLIII